MCYIEKLINLEMTVDIFKACCQHHSKTAVGNFLLENIH